jgi:hypothetical protein
MQCLTSKQQLMMMYPLNKNKKDNTLTAAILVMAATLIFATTMAPSAQGSQSHEFTELKKFILRREQ